MSEDAKVSESKSIAYVPLPQAVDDIESQLTEVFLDLESFSAGELSKLCISRDFFGTLS